MLEIYRHQLFSFPFCSFPSAPVLFSFSKTGIFLVLDGVEIGVIFSGSGIKKPPPHIKQSNPSRPCCTQQLHQLMAKKFSEQYSLAGY